jgi:hypothetical protein
VAAIIQGLRKSWDRFARAEPGHRFENQYRRALRRRSPARTIGRICLGVVLTAGGVFLWFVPGPGWLFVLFGVAMFASESQRLSKFLDAAELAVRARARQLRRRWRSGSPAFKAGVVAALLLICGLGSAAALAMLA